MKKHPCIQGSKVNPMIWENTRFLYCENCQKVPKYLNEKEWFAERKWWEFFKDTEVVTWKICYTCYTPLMEKRRYEIES